MDNSLSILIEACDEPQYPCRLGDMADSKVLCVCSVQVDGEVVSRIGPGLLVLVGISVADTEADSDFMCVQTARLKRDKGAWEGGQHVHEKSMRKCKCCC